MPTDDRYWRMGSIYNNPDDGALWVEKRFGLGYTINMGRPDAKKYLLGFVLRPTSFLVLLFL
ncbi:MAG: DUF5808 domain-containing protein [Acidobacteriota bacterium]|nr:DUF5808 domain-containing protein [Acidobacteriota bacterium]